jgi:hypothetical protein
MYEIDADAPYVLKVFKPGQTNPLPHVNYRDDDCERVKLLERYWRDKGYHVRLIDNTLEIATDA